jgi:OmcA/MtrC family decaheme c-type cytochrome
MALAPTISPSDISVSINTASGVAGTPVVKFKVTDGNGNPVVGLGGQYPAVGTAVTHTNYNLNFTLAKLLPAANGSPSKWVNLLVDKPAAAGAAGSVVNNGLSWLAAFPTADAQGTLVDNGDGTYQYTFLRDIKQTQAIVGGVADSVNAKADLEYANLAFDPTATHRLGIMILGSQPGTGINTPTATAQLTPVPLLKTFNIGYDFRPDGNPITNTRDIVDAGSCDACHDNVNLKRGIGHVSITATSNLAVSYNASGVATTVTMSNGIPAGTYVGRNDPRICVTCHTDQTKYGFTPVTGDGTYAYGNTAYKRVAAGVMSDNQSAFTYPRMIHQTHMGNQLVKTGYNLNGHDANCASLTVAKDAAAAQCLNGVGLPMEQRNCTKCHTGVGSTGTAVATKDGDNWKKVPSQLACGACHDGINFATGTGSTLKDKMLDELAGNAAGTTQSGHAGGAGGLADNSTCTTCHNIGQISDIAVLHRSVYSTPNNPVAQTGVKKVAFDIKTVTVNAAGNPVVTFQIAVDGTAITSLPVHVPVTNGVSGAKVVNTYAEPIPGLISGPSIYVAFAVPQDGIATPSDFNARFNVALANLLIDTTAGVAPVSPAMGYMSGYDATTSTFKATSGYFTATLTGDKVGQAKGAGCVAPTAPTIATCVSTAVSASYIAIPANASMVTGAVIGSFTQINLAAYPYTKGDLTTNKAVAATGTGLRVAGVLKKLVASTCSQTGISAAQVTACKTPRRVIVALDKCNTCHEQLGTNQYMDNNPLANGFRLGFHNGERNDPTACNICHNGNGVDSAGFTYDSGTFYHAIHAASKRTVPFVINGGLDFSQLLFPGQLKNCSHCHLDNTANFGIAEATGQLANKLWSYTSKGTVNAQPNLINQVTDVATSSVPVTYPAGTLLPAPSVATTNKGFSYAISSANVPSATYATDGTLLSSPFAAACSSCHDDWVSQNHIAIMGGQVNAVHSVVSGTQTAASGVPGSDVALRNTETCVTCHGQGRQQDAILIHQIR